MEGQPRGQQQQQQPGQQTQAQEPQEGRPSGHQWLGTTAENCREMVDRASTRNPMVRFMLEKMEEVRVPPAGGPPAAAAAHAPSASRQIPSSTFKAARPVWSGPLPSATPSSRVALQARASSR